MLRTTCEADFRTLCVRSCIPDGSFEWSYFVFWRDHSQRQRWGYCVTCLVGALPYAHFVMPSPFSRVKVLHSAQCDITGPVSGLPPKLKIEKKKKGPWWSSSRSERRVSQRRCHPTLTPAGGGGGGGRRGGGMARKRFNKRRAWGGIRHEAEFKTGAFL